MSREVFAITHDYSVQANFTAWAGGTHTAILNRGWLQSTETGEIDPTTVTVPSSGAYAGFVVYKTNDGVGTQFFLKIKYGRSTSTRHPKMEISLGTGTNGSGTLTGNLGGVYDVWAELNDDGGLNHLSLVAGTAGRLVIITDIQQTSPTSWTHIIVIARSVDAAGAPNSNGMQMWLFGNQTLYTKGTQEFIPAPGYSSIVDPQTLIVCPWPMQDTAAARWRRGSKIYFAHPVAVHEVDSQYPNPFVVITDNGNSVPALTTAGMYRLTSYGTTRNYYLTNFQLGGGALNGGSASPCVD